MTKKPSVKTLMDSQQAKESETLEKLSTAVFLPYFFITTLF